MQRPLCGAGPGHQSAEAAAQGGRQSKRKKRTTSGSAQRRATGRTQGFHGRRSEATRSRHERGLGRRQFRPAPSDEHAHAVPGPRGTLPAPTFAPALCGVAPRRHGRPPPVAPELAPRRCRARANAARPRRRRSPDRLTTRPGGPGRFLQQGSFRVSRASIPGCGADRIRPRPAVMCRARAPGERGHGAKECTT